MAERTSTWRDLVSHVASRWSKTTRHACEGWLRNLGQLDSFIEASGRSSLRAGSGLILADMERDAHRKGWVASAVVACVLGVAATCGGASGASRSSASGQRATHAPVPAPYRALYDEVSAEIGAYQRGLAAMPRLGGSRRRPVAGAELLAANGNGLTALLKPTTIRAVDISLDRLHKLGVRGVTLAIKVPMLLSWFSRDARRYRDFYATVARHIRARGMAVSVELGFLFCSTPYARCTRPLHESYQRFISDTAAQARIVLERVRPDYLTLMAEPDTEAQLTGIHQLDTPSGAARAVREMLARIGSHRHTKIGAGAGTWLPISFAQRIAKQPIDYLDTHIYPVGPFEATNAVSIASIARKAHLALVIDEVWLYKSARPGVEGGVSASLQVFRRDMFSFWQPLDERFLAVTARWAANAGAAYVSAFWSWQFFAYLTWTPELDALPYSQLTATLYRAVTPALIRGTATDVGLQWGREG